MMQRLDSHNDNALTMTIASESDLGRFGRLLSELEAGVVVTVRLEDGADRASPSRTHSFADAMRVVEATYYDAP